MDSISGNGEVLMAIWLVFSIILICVIAMFFPTMGFDATPRPELWWIRLVMSISPLFVAAFSPYVLILLPAIWFSLALSLVIPWYVEEDVKDTNSTQLNITFVLVALFALLIVPNILYQLNMQLIVAWLLMPLVPLLMSSVLLFQARKQNPTS
jgi:hypothetical protein